MHKTLFWTAAVLILYGTLSHSPVGVPGSSDKFLHFTAFLGFSYLLSRAYDIDSGKTVLISIAFAGAMEMLQFMLEYRTFDILDWHYGNMGALVGIGLYYIRNRYHDFIYT